MIRRQVLGAPLTGTDTSGVFIGFCSSLKITIREFATRKLLTPLVESSRHAATQPTLIGSK